jgi:hypothetical protein
MTAETITEPTITTEHPSWCDPRICDIDSSIVPDRKHYTPSEDVTLSLHDRSEDYVQFVAPFALQSVGDLAPTLGLWSETVSIDRGIGSGFQMEMTRQDFIALWIAMGRLIDPT